MQRTGQVHKRDTAAPLAQAIVGLVLFILVVGLWVSRWVPLWPTR